jgi:glycosyltransferase involved in cell wall biosynthesis
MSVGGFAGVYRTLKQAKTLADAGVRVVFVGYEGLVPEAYLDSGLDVVLVKASTLGSSEHPVWVIRVALNLTVHRVRNWWLDRRRHPALREAVGNTGAHFVQCVELPGLEVAHQAARRFGARLIYDSNELWSGFLQSPDMNAPSDFAARLLDVERRLIAKADLVLTPSDALAARLSQNYAIRSPLTILNAPPNRAESARPVSRPVRLVFHGGLSADRNIDGLIRAMVYLNDRATLDIHGFSRTVQAGALQDLIDELGLGSVVRLHGSFEYEHVVEMLKDYDVGVMANRVVEGNFDVALPNKIFDCMCAGLAIAMTGSTAVCALLEEVPYGITVDPASPETIAHDLGALVDDSGRIQRMKQEAVAASSRYWWPEQGKKLVAAFEDMLRKN